MRARGARDGPELVRAAGDAGGDRSPGLHAGARGHAAKRHGRRRAAPRPPCRAGHWLSDLRPSSRPAIPWWCSRTWGSAGFRCGITVAIGYDLSSGDLVLHSGLDARRAAACHLRADLGARRSLGAGGPATRGAACIGGRGGGAARRVPSSRREDARGRHRLRRHRRALARQPRGLDRPRQRRVCRRRSRGGGERLPDGDRAPPRRRAAWNNLAHVLGEKGRRREAIAAAERAVRLGGPNAATYRATLREVSGT